MEEQNPKGMQALVPGESPVFKAGPGWGAKIKKNFTRLVLPLIAIAIVAIGLIMFLDKNGEENKLTEPKTETEEISDGGISIQEVETKKGQTENIYKVGAKQGDGITHLARKTLKEYLNVNPSVNSGLRDEHKIYIEDYLKDLNGERLLEIGEEIGFSENEITRAIQMAKNLSENQLTNLSQFVPFVSGL
ncbi:MAG: hypothetical protein AAB627_00350 [Patescibacteria group bacterium]